VDEAPLISSVVVAGSRLRTIVQAGGDQAFGRSAVTFATTLRDVPRAGASIPAASATMNARASSSFARDAIPTSIRWMPFRTCCASCS
jgi:hypothetical protein